MCGRKVPRALPKCFEHTFGMPVPRPTLVRPPSRTAGDARAACSRKGAPMKLTRWSVAAGVAASVAVTLNVVPASAGTTAKPSDQSLRALGARHGLYIGTAVDTTALADAADPQYRQITASQFSTVTPENVMKWDTLEPTRGT